MTVGELYDLMVDVDYETEVVFIDNHADHVHDFHIDYGRVTPRTYGIALPPEQWVTKPVLELGNSGL